MSVHRAKGLEFGVVAVPQLDRNLLSGGWAPLLAFGRGGDPRVGMQLRRLGAPAINVFAHEALRDEDNERDAEEGLRLFHVAATRAREHLLLSGVVKEKPAKPKPSTSVIERMVEALEIDRETPSRIPIPAPAPRPGLEASFPPSELEVRVNAPSLERAKELTERHPSPPSGRDDGDPGPAPLLARRPPSVPRRPLSYSAISQYEDCGYRFQLERVFGFGKEIGSAAEAEPSGPSAREERTARGRVVHSLLEWSQANDWSLPPKELLDRHLASEGLETGEETAAELLGVVTGWLESELLAERIAVPGARVRSEVPLLLEVGGSVLRGSIDLLAESGERPLVVDYKTDRLDGRSPAEHAAEYDIQRSIYALAVAEARSAEAVEVAYVFLERPAEPQLAVLGPEGLAAARGRLEEVVARIAAGVFPAAPPERRSGGLCRGCPALKRACSGPG
jgi:ATP-dependent helicase/nuclease subunit A